MTLIEKKLIISNAISFAEKFHYGYFRKFTGEPYVEHPIRVAEYANQFNLPLESVIVSYLHDTLEDTKATEIDIKNLFGSDILMLVLELTSNKSESNKIGKTQYLINKMNRMSNQAFTIKLLDRLDNVTNIIESPEKFCIKYSKETKEILNNIEPNCDVDIIIINKINLCIEPALLKYGL